MPGFHGDAAVRKQKKLKNLFSESKLTIGVHGGGASGWGGGWGGGGVE